MKITYLGHSSILLTTSDNQNILIDPFISTGPTSPIQFKDLPSIDLLVLTHGHADHTSDIFNILERDNSKLIATYELGCLISTLAKSPVKYDPMNKGGTIELKELNLKISLTHAHHSNSYTTEDGISHYAGEACGVILNFNNGPCIYHAGDTCYFEEMKLIREFYAPSLAFLPIGDRFTMGPKEAGISAQALGVKTAIPIHWGTFPLLTGTPSEFKEECITRDVEAITLEPGVTLDL